jgi:PelA/Pel-15E family pectate lyase
MRLAAKVFCVSILGLAMGAGEEGVFIDHWRNMPDEWYRSDEGKRVVANVISWQYPQGGWHKSYDTLSPRPEHPTTAATTHSAKAPGAPGGVWDRVCTIDNDATHSELQLLARAYALTKNEAALASFNRGMAYLLEAQYPDGGWPQRFPLQDNYGKYITFNDDAMLGVLRLMYQAGEGQGTFSFVPAGDRAKYRAAFQRGLACTLDCQIKVNGVPTVWCQQHEDVTHVPAPGRAYELAVPCSAESANLVYFLMDIPNPDEKLRASIEGAVAWFESHKIVGMEYKRLKGSEYENGEDRYLVPNASALPLWARFYDPEKDVPLFVDRKGNKYYDVRQVPYERRLGYSWYGTQGVKVLKKYPTWKAGLK